MATLCHRWISARGYWLVGWAGRIRGIDRTAHAMLIGEVHCLGTVRDANLGEEMVDVALDRALADEQALGDRRVGQPGSDQVEHLGLAGREPAERRSRGRCRIGAG